jgi:hypothetical protein
MTRVDIKSDTSQLDTISRDLDQASSQLRSGDLDPQRAAELATHCAELASQASIELDRLARAAPEASLPGQEELL